MKHARPRYASYSHSLGFRFPSILVLPFFLLSRATFLSASQKCLQNISFALSFIRHLYVSPCRTVALKQSIPLNKIQTVDTPAKLELTTAATTTTTPRKPVTIIITLRIEGNANYTHVHSFSPVRSLTRVRTGEQKIIYTLKTGERIERVGGRIGIRICCSLRARNKCY